MTVTATANSPIQLGDPVFENISHDPRHSFYWHTHGYPSPIARWNYHPEYELHLIRRSSGRYMVGDHVDRFEPGNLVLVGPNVPHAWFSDLTDDNEVIDNRDVVVQFRGDWFDGLARSCPELGRVAPMMKASARGIEFSGHAALEAASRLQRMGEQPPLTRLASLLELLGRLTDSTYRLLASPCYQLERSGVRSEQVDAILQYVHRHFDQPLSMADIAAWQGMTPSTFSRLFKRTTGDTFVAFVRRLRLEYACRLLFDRQHSIAEVCFMVGYGNLSNFNRHFRRLTGSTPRAYRASTSAQEPETTRHSRSSSGR